MHIVRMSRNVQHTSSGEGVPVPMWFNVLFISVVLFSALGVAWVIWQLWRTEREDSRKE